MELSLHRSDVFHVASISGESMTFLPLGKSKTQKLVIGDDSGAVNSISWKKGEVSGPVVLQQCENPIMALSLSGSIGKKDRLFFCEGSSIHGVNKKV